MEEFERPSCVFPERSIVCEINTDRGSLPVRMSLSVDADEDNACWGDVESMVSSDESHDAVCNGGSTMQHATSGFASVAQIAGGNQGGEAARLRRFETWRLGKFAGLGSWRRESMGPFSTSGIPHRYNRGLES